MDYVAQLREDLWNISEDDRSYVKAIRYEMFISSLHILIALGFDHQFLYFIYMLYFCGLPLEKGSDLYSRRITSVQNV